MCNAAPAEILGVIALRGADAILTRNRELVRAQRRAGGRPGRPPSRTGSRGTGRARARSGSRACSATSRSTTSARRLRAEQGVLLLPGTVYGHGGNHFRIGFGRIDAPDALARLDAFLQTA